MNNGGSAAQMLRGFIYDIEDIDKQIEELKKKRKTTRDGAKGKGFSIKAIDRVIADRKLTPAQRKAKKQLEAEQDAIVDLYQTAMGDKPEGLSDEARKRLSDPAPDEDDSDDADGGADGDAAGGTPDQAEMPAAAITSEDLENAIDEGREAARSAKTIYENPYVAKDPRRGKWDEGWCLESGSDGMEIPDAYKPKPKEKKKKEGAAETASDGDGEQA